MRNGHLRETPDGKIFSINDLHQYQWDFATGSWTVVPGTCELCERNDDYEPEALSDVAEALDREYGNRYIRPEFETSRGLYQEIPATWGSQAEPKLVVGKAYIASNPDGAFQELGGITGITFSGSEDEEAWRLANPSLKDIRTDKTDTFTVTFKNAEETVAALGYPTSTAAWPVNMKAWDDALRRERESRQANRQRWFTPKKVKYPQLTERQMSPSVYTPQPEDPLFTSEEIEKAAQHLGVELTPWQEELLSRASKSSLIMASFPRRNGRTNVTKVANKLAEWQGATAGEPIYDETSTEGKKLSKKERIAELEAQVEALENDNLELDKLSDDERTRAGEAELKLDQQLEINHTLKTRITNQRTELRRLNGSLREHSAAYKYVQVELVKALGYNRRKAELVESKQRTIESQQEIIDGLRAQLAKKSWWRS